MSWRVLVRSGRVVLTLGMANAGEWDTEGQNGDAGGWNVTSFAGDGYPYKEAIAHLSFSFLFSSFPSSCNNLLT